MAMQTATLVGFRLSPLQRRFWVSHPDGQALRSQGAVLVEGPLDVRALRTALEKVVERHEILRTRFPRPAGMKIPLQVVSDRLPPHWHVSDDDVRADGDHDARIAEFCREEARRPFDFEQGPLFHAALLALSEQEHVLLLSMPSLCGDARSLSILVREIASAYAGDAGGDDLVEQPLQYADFSEWHNQLLEGDDEPARSAKEYWASLDLDSVPPLALPFQGKAEPATGFEPAGVTVKIAGELLVNLEAFARQYDTSSATCLLTCWQALLGRLAGQDEVVVGNVVDGRQLEEVREAVGLFAQALPIRACVANRSFAELLRQVAAAVGAACRWQAYHDDAITCSQAGGVASAGVEFELETLPATQIAGAISFSLYQQLCHLTPFRLKLSCARGADSCLATFFYDPRLFRRPDVERLAGYFKRLLESSTREPAAPLGSLEILDAGERQQLLVAFNQTAADYPRDVCLPQLFEEQVQRVPECVALTFEGRQWTYAELNARANELAHALRRRGVTRNVPVGLCVERSGEMFMALLGILKAGGAYVPLHPEHPKPRLAYQLEETHAPVVVTEEKLLGQFPDFQGELLCLDRDRAVLASEPQTNPDRVNLPEDLVYVIYTSGSTGVPKGVAVRHRNLVNYAHFIKRKLGLGEAADGDGLHFATVSTLNADLGNTCIGPSLTTGGCLHVIGYETSTDGQRFARYLSQHPVDVLKITPSHLAALLAGQGGEAALPRRFLILGGEAASWELVRQVKAVGRCAVINHYGPTETTVGSLTFDVRDDGLPRSLAATVPIGRPIANTDVYLLDPFGKPVPIGVAGELHIGGAGVAQGYFNQPEQTAERFIRHPLSGDPDARVYRTGDRARYLPDGNIEFLGRLDQQVKVRGFRVEPAEVEGALRQHPAVRQAVVLAQGDPSGDRRLAAYFVPAREGLTADQLRGFLAERLPEYMVPAAWVSLATLPLTPNGKVDRRALPDPEQARLANGKAYRAPRSACEEKLAAIWAEVLGVERVGVEDDFFELGGHSLLATQLVARVRNAFQVQISLRSIFDTPTVVELAETIRQLLEGGEGEELDRLLTEVEGLSDEAIERLLAEEGAREGS